MQFVILRAIICTRPSLTESMPVLHIYNSLSRKKEAFAPIEEGKVGMYVCGMTVYGACHLGHGRMLVAFDIVVRFLRSLGYEVNYVRNITDIDDKIINRANENKEDYTELTERVIAQMHSELAFLNVAPPTHEPRATHHIDEMIEMIEQLIKLDYAYQGKKGDVYYRVRKFDAYGRLSGKDINDLRVGARVEEDNDKEDPVDFVLWKQAKPNEPFWASPWGEGRPGWHIECSAMSKQCLADNFDIHGGGQDLQFPHHENEIAQSEAATGCTFANYWMHNGFVQLDKEKMSKSLGNFFTISEILAQDTHPQRMGEVIRFMMLASHYRSPLNYSGQALENARSALERLYKVAERIQSLGVKVSKSIDAEKWVQPFQAAMCDDFNTPEALAVLFEVARVINRQLDAGETPKGEIAAFKVICEALGIAYQLPEYFLGTAKEDQQAIIVEGLTGADIDELLAQRAEAKAKKDWSRADEIRDQLTGLGISIEDKAGNLSNWTYKS